MASGGLQPTAYAIRSPLGSDERGVGCPRVVEGEAAQMASGRVSLGRGEEDWCGSPAYLRQGTWCGVCTGCSVQCAVTMTTEANRIEAKKATRTESGITSGSR
jgi:hypothetical protein